MKGSNTKDEINNSINAIKILGGKLLETDEFLISDTDIRRRIVEIKKINKTPNKYPRKAGTPSKEPL